MWKIWVILKRNGHCCVAYMSSRREWAEDTLQYLEKRIGTDYYDCWLEQAPVSKTK